MHGRDNPNRLLNKMSEPLIGRPAYQSPHNVSGDVERPDWAALLAAAVQVAYRHDTRPFLPLAKGLARQTSKVIGFVCH